MIIPLFYPPISLKINFDWLVTILLSFHTISKRNIVTSDTLLVVVLYSALSNIVTVAAEYMFTFDTFLKDLPDCILILYTSEYAAIHDFQFPKLLEFAFF